MRIRKATSNDAKSLVAAEQQTAETPGLLVSRPRELTLDAFEQKLAELDTAGRYVVAEEEGQVVGHALLDPMPLEAIAHVVRLTIVVHPGFLGQGIGAMLMHDLLDWAQLTANVQKIELLVRATNARAIHLYSKLGFVEEGRFKNRIRLPDGSFIDDIAMAWFPDKSISSKL